MNRFKAQRIAVYLFWLACSVAICWNAVRLNLGQLTEPGPGFMPFIMGVLMFVLTIAGFFEKRASETEYLRITEGKFLTLASTMASLWIYAFLLPVIGFVLDSLLLMVFLFAVIQKLRWATAIVASVITVAVCYALFTSLGTEFPKGFFG